MCACDFNYVCSRCTDTPQDPSYVENEPQEVNRGAWGSEAEPEGE